MLRTNLSTRPFYNERGVHLLLLLVALIVGGVTLANVYELLQLSRQNTELSTNVNRDRAEADRLTRDAARIRRGINPDELQLFEDVAELTPEDAVIAGNPWNGSALAYAFTGRRVLFPHVGGAYTVAPCRSCPRSSIASANVRPSAGLR